MEAVKMLGTTQMKSQVKTTTTSSDAPKGSDEFMKLLQVKKDQAKPDKAEGKPTDGKNGQKDVENVSQGKKEEPKDTEEQKVADDTAVDQDALLQAAMQQTAAQMAGIVTVESPASEEAPAEVEIAAALATEDTAPIPEARPSVKEEAQPEKAEQVPMKVTEQPKTREEESQTPADQGETLPRQEELRVPDGGSEVRKDQEEKLYKVQTEAKPQDTSRTEEKTDSLNSVYSQETQKAETQQVFESPKTEVSLKTSQDALPQDLGRTLADRLPGTGRELVVELEPANLGKLTIKMVYEAGKAAVSIIATNPKTLEILNQKAAEIAAILEEKTGQETLIYTEAPQQESQEENPNQDHGRRGEGQGQEERHGDSQERRHDVESFAQQLRLGLV